MTMRSGRSVSSIAQPSRRNSGFETTSNATGLGWWRSMTSRTRSPVPTGTVDLLTTTVYRSIARPISRATASAAPRSVFPVSVGGGPAEEHDRERQEWDQTGRHPHDDPTQTLVVERCQAEEPGRRRVKRVEDLLGAGDHRRDRRHRHPEGEEVEDLRAVMEPRRERGRGGDRPPREHGGREQDEVLD